MKVGFVFDCLLGSFRVCQHHFYLLCRLYLYSVTSSGGSESGCQLTFFFHYLPCRYNLPSPLSLLSNFEESFLFVFFLKHHPAAAVFQSIIADELLKKTHAISHLHLYRLRTRSGFESRRTYNQVVMITSSAVMSHSLLVD